MSSEPDHPAESDPLRQALSTADDRVRLSRWLPPRSGIIPHIRMGKRWINVLWFIPIVVAVLIVAIAIAQALRELDGVQAFIAAYPGTPATEPAVTSGYPWWLRPQHFANMVFMLFIIRAGIQILADHPRLYWHRDSTPGTEWFRFQKDVPTDRIWTAKDDAVTLPKWLGIPGLRHTIGLARWWHFSVNLLWVVNGALFYILIFATDQWQRIIPLTWDVFPNALSTALQYASLDFPPDEAWTRFNSLQQLTYFVTVFIAAPTSIITGLLQAPAISNRIGWVGKVFNRQVARSIHFIAFAYLVGFILVHGILVLITGLGVSTNRMFAGVENATWTGFWLFTAAMLFMGLCWFWASPFTLRNARLVQRVGAFMVGWLKGAAERPDPKSQLAEKDISPHFWPNGTDALVGRVRSPADASVRALSAARRWPGGISCGIFAGAAEGDAGAKANHHAFLHPGLVGCRQVGRCADARHSRGGAAKPEARYVVFYSLADGSDGGRYYDVHEITNMRHELTILAYEMNDAPPTVLHGAPLRLRCENELGFKMVKWIAAIEFVAEFKDIGAGQGGYNEDHESYGYRMPI